MGRAHRDPRPADVRHLDAAIVLVAQPRRQRRTRPRNMPSPGWPGDSSDSANSTCSPRQIPRYGLPPRIESTMARPSGASGPSALAQSPNAPCPGTTTRAASRTTARIRGHAHRLQRAGRLERLGHRAQVAEPGVDDRDHARSHHRSRASFVASPSSTARRRRRADRCARRPRSRARTPSTAPRGCGARSPVVQPQVQVALAAVHERLEELVRQLGVEAADPLAGDAVDAATPGAAAPKSRPPPAPASRPSAPCTRRSDGCRACRRAPARRRRRARAPRPRRRGARRPRRRRARRARGRRARAARTRRACA